MIFSLDILPALKGDCFLLHFGKRHTPGLILIDGGPAGVYGQSLKPRLNKIREVRKIGSDQRLPIDLVIVSHIDDDHIHGVLDLFSGLARNVREQSHQFVEVRALWHNSFPRLMASDPSEMQMSSANYDVAARQDILEVSEFDIDLAKVLASVPQGIQLDDHAAAIGIPCCDPQPDGLSYARPDEIRFPDLSIRILGPQHEELKRLRTEYQKWQNRRREKETRNREAACLDQNPFNLSSIVALVESGNKRILLTGDARGDKIIEALSRACLLGENSTLQVDILKVPHHGSDRNLDERFFETIIANHYVISGNGQHGNPERATLEMLARAGRNRDFCVHLTYSIEQIDAARCDEHEGQHRNDPSRTSLWNSEANSLAAFLEKTPEFAQKLRFVPPNGAPHVIDLGDEPLGF